MGLLSLPLEIRGFSRHTEICGLGAPLITPWRLTQNWPGSELVIVSEAGHDTRDPGMTESIVAATDGFRAGE